MKYRPATPSDIKQMSEIRIAVKENPLLDPSLITFAMYEDYLDRLGRGWVCEAGDEILGFSYAEKSNHSIWALFVRPGHEGKGIGKKLIALATEWLFEQGAEKVVLDTEANTRADAFYQSQGWIRGEMKDEYEVSYTLVRHTSGEDIR